MSCSACAGSPTSADEEPERYLLAGLQALADPSRLRIVTLLRERERCVCHLVEALDVKQSTISHHMSVLKRAGLVVDRRDEKDARWTYYSLSPSAVRLGRGIVSLLDAAGVDPAPADCSGR
jgi:ArsR family transcriptional regulator